MGGRDGERGGGESPAPKPKLIGSILARSHPPFQQTAEQIQRAMSRDQYPGNDMPNTCEVA